MTPKAFKNGGYLFSPIALIMAAMLQMYCAVKLTQCGMLVKKISYPDIADKAMGRQGKKLIELCLAVIHFQFTIAQLAFIVEGIKSTVESMTGKSTLKEIHIGLIVLSLFSPLAWVRKIETFKIGFMFGFAMIVVTIITISVFCFSMNISSSEPDELSLSEWGFIPINKDSYFSTIGFFFFLFEGIGGVMPIMSATRDRESFPILLCGTFMFLCMMHIGFAELCYYTFGNNLTKAIIMEHMPAANPIIQVVKILFMINLVFSYPLTIFITNLILESITFKNCSQNTK